MSYCSYCHGTGFDPREPFYTLGYRCPKCDGNSFYDDYSTYDYDDLDYYSDDDDNKKDEEVEAETEDSIELGQRYLREYREYQNIQPYLRKAMTQQKQAQHNTHQNETKIPAALHAKITAALGILNAASRRKFTFLLVGRTGVGKSSTVNKLIGKEIASVGDFVPTTLSVRFYSSQIEGIELDIIDTPGLCDDLPEKGNDELYLTQIRRQVKQIDCLLFVAPLYEHRLRSDEMRGIQLISEAFGQQVWKKSVIVFTFADRILANEYSKFLTANTNLLRQEIGKHTGNNIAQEIPALAVSNRLQETPDGKLWLGELYAKVFTRISEEGALPFLLATANRLRLVNDGKKVEPSAVVSDTINEDAKNHNSKVKNQESRTVTITDNEAPPSKEQHKSNQIHQKTSSPASSTISYQQSSTVEIPNSETQQAPYIILNQQQQIEIQERISTNTELNTIPDIKRVLELFALGASVGLNLSGGNPIGAITAGTIFAAAEIISWLFKRQKSTPIEKKPPITE
jgi:GTP-binding protein EngB required for normal cell division